MEQRPEGQDLFEQHLRLMSGDNAVAAQDADEAMRVRALYLPPRRKLSTRAAARRPPWVFGIATLAAVAAGLLLTMHRPQEATLRFKGQTKVSLVWQRQGALLDWTDKAQVLDGDRVSAEVTAARSTIAFLAVYDRDGHLLGDAASMISNRLELAAGERSVFVDGFEVTGANEGEILAVIACDREAYRLSYLPRAAPREEIFIEKIRLLPASTDRLDAGCVTDQIRLRY